MNITTYPYHLTEQQLKLFHVRNPSTDSGKIKEQAQTGPILSLSFETDEEILFYNLGYAQVIIIICLINQCNQSYHCSKGWADIEAKNKSVSPANEGNMS